MRKYSRFLWFFLLAHAAFVPIGSAKAACWQSVTVYAETGCPYCAKTEQFLSENGVQYERIEVDNADVIDEIQQKFGARSVPVVVVDGRFVVGYDEAWLRQNLCLE